MPRRPSSSAAADTALARYQAMRDFDATPEPRGGAQRRPGNLFVVQKHEATRLHHDFRLELDGVLKSWAVTRGPSLNPEDKRLAVRTEDHPLDYGSFEGTIPKGQYGGGTVMLWDRGTWQPEDDDPAQALSRGKLSFVLHGERMKGRWTLVRMRSRNDARRKAGAPKGGREAKENWLLIKHQDEHASATKRLTGPADRSIASGRTMAAIARGNAEGAQARQKLPADKTRSAGKPAPPAFIAPQLATLHERAPEGPDWLHEAKYDGYRCLVAIGGGAAVCYTRSGQDWSARFAAIRDAAAGLDVDEALIDGEVVSEPPPGQSAFAALQRTIKSGDTRLGYFAFDLLRLNGKDLRKQPLEARKQALARLLAATDGPIRYAEHVTGHGQAVLDALCAAGHEGIVAKRRDAAYVSRRTPTWLKIKCTRRQEFVIGGWTPSTRRSGFASLLLGYFREGELVYAGRVGTGFNADLRADIAGRLKARARRTQPFAPIPPFTDLPRAVTRTARWVRPDLVAEVAFSEFTGDGLLRHPAFIALREDKPATQIVRETGGDTMMSEMSEKSASGNTVSRTTSKTAASTTPAAKASKKAGSKATAIAGVRFTNPGRVLFPTLGLTKADLAAYYLDVADLMLAHLRNRPVSFLRCPQGRARQCFFQRHAGSGLSPHIRTIAIAEASGQRADYVYIRDLKGILAAVQMGVLELHIWGCRIDDPERPDRLVFDLDPDEGLAFADVRQAALDLRAVLQEELDLASFAMLTGGKGVHVVVPLQRRAGWPEVKDFAKGVAEAMARAQPDRFVATMSKAKRTGRIFIDHFRNQKSASAIAPYSTRARQGAPVAAPVSWRELEQTTSAALFSTEAMRARAKALNRDPWEDYAGMRQALSKRRLARIL